jgi:CO/xanthine dehydrogenase Mo-binding subunit/aerobic-type carbon monoxide dehydrogenase small subunit (CoxS/CutS family)
MTSHEPPLLIRLTVNGETVEADVPAALTLQELLHGRLGWRDVRFGCGEGVCGACAVLLDGAPRASCLLLAAQADGADITTAAGLSRRHGTTFDTLREHLVGRDAFQCGYCACGMLVTAVHYLVTSEERSDAALRKALSGNLCRCSGYAQIVEGIAAASQSEALPEGGPPRPGLREKVDGTARYPTDRRGREELVGRILWSAWPSARILRIDTRAALEVDGVEAVFTARDVPGQNLGGVSLFVADQALLAEDRVRSRSDAVAVVAARSESAAREALGKIAVTYEPTPPVLSVEAALEEGAPKVGEGKNTIAQFSENRGDVEAGLRSSDVVVEATYRTTINDHACMEPEGGAAWYEGDCLILTFPSQSPYVAHQMVARILGVEEETVRVETARAGGGFGKYLATSVEGFLALLAHGTGKPVRMRLSREEALSRSAKRHEFVGRYRMGLRRDGTMLALEADVLTDAGPYVGLTPAVVSVFAVEAAGGYEIPNLRIRVRGVLTNNLMTAPMRGFGTQQIAFGIESLVEKAAHTLAMSPVSLRLKNATSTRHDGEGTSIQVERAVLGETLERVVQRMGPRPEPPRGWLAGRGFSSVHAKYGFPFGFVDRFSARLSVDVEGCFVVETDVPDLGTGIDVGLPGLAARRLGLAKLPRYVLSRAALDDPTGFYLQTHRPPTHLRRVAYRAIERLQTTVAGGLQGAIAGLPYDTHELVTRRAAFLINTFGSMAARAKAAVAPAGVDSFLPRMGGSRSISMAGRAVVDAADRLDEEARRLASDVLEVPASDLICDDAGVRHHTDRDRLATWAALASAAGGSLEAVGTAALPPGKIFHPTTGNQVGPVDFTDASHGCDLIVHPESGEVRIVRYVVSQDVGRAFDMEIIRGQIYGGVVMGISQVLYEKIRVGESGVTTTGLHDYLVPTSLDVPDCIEIDLLESESGFGPEGAKGIGESPAVTAPIAVANALYDALGVQIETIPVTPEEIVALAQRPHGAI